MKYKRNADAGTFLFLSTRRHLVDIKLHAPSSSREDRQILKDPRIKVFFVQLLKTRFEGLPYYHTTHSRSRHFPLAGRRKKLPQTFQTKW